MATTTEGQTNPQSSKKTVQLEGATVRLAGDSGDGMQLLGTQLTNTSALLGNDVATFPDFPAEIRAPRGTRAGVSGFQVQFSSQDIFTPGDRLDALVVMNPAALVTNVADLDAGGILVVNEDSFDERELKLANLPANPLEDGSLDKFHVFRVPMTKLTRTAVEDLGLSTKIADRCRNFFAMGLVYWLFGRDPSATLRFIRDKFGNKPDIAQANEKALWAGWNYGETTEAFVSRYEVDAAKLPPGTYRNIMGNQALAWGLLAAADRSDKPLFLGTYPITPASDILHELTQVQELRHVDLPGGRRNRGRLRYDRCRLWRCHGRDHDQWTGYRAQGRGHGLGGHAGIALHCRQCAARRAQHRVAHQDRAGGPVPGPVRPQRRVPDAGGGRGQSGRLL